LLGWQAGWPPSAEQERANSYLSQLNASSKTRVLFVDDEPLILELFQLTVQAMNGEWETSFVGSGEKALRLMESQSFDLIVSDMRMPGMSGAHLLNEVMKRYPATSRIILSGYADREEVFRCVGAAHQFLAKPCERPTIEATLNRIRGLRERLRSEEIQKLVGKQDSLPSIPAVYFKIVEALQEPDCSIERIGEVVASDPALTAKILQLVNSAFFGFAREVSSASEAAMLLGIGTIRSLAFTLHLFSAFKAAESEAWSLDRVWKHSLRVGQWAKKIAHLEATDENLAEQAFTAGVLHDVGKLILADNLAETYLELVARASKENRPLIELEDEALGATHAEVGAYLLALWGLPAPLVEAVASHHEPGRTSGLAFSPLTAVHVANVLEQASQGSDSNAVLDRLDSLYLDRLGLGSRVQVWREKLV
jgi:putative nucleotidyltransferase with HDIG domain